MNDKIKRQVEWLADELLSNAANSVMIHIVYDNNEGNAKVYLNGERIATISEMVSTFNFPLSDKQTAELYLRTCGHVRECTEREGDMNE
ncbi:MAG: hypothetical protein ACXQTL_02245 [Methanosarcinales archaeon]